MNGTLLCFVLFGVLRQCASSDVTGLSLRLKFKGLGGFGSIRVLWRFSSHVEALLSAEALAPNLLILIQP